MKQQHNNPANILEQIRKLSREFGKQLSGGKSPRIEKYLSQVPEEGREDLFANLIATEVNFRRSQGESPTSDEYVNRFPQFKKQVRRAFFESSMSLAVSDVGTDDEDQTATRRRPSQEVDPLAPAFDLPAGNRLGDYELVRKLGQGGMGIVYEARHTETNNRVALKTLPTGGDGQQVNADRLYRFRKEFRRLSEVNHPNLVGMQSLEVDGGRWFFTMDLVDGEDFLSYVRPDDHLHEARLRSCLKQLATGVLELHHRGVIHRDLKPSNVLISPEGHLTILDFGLAAQLQRAGDMSQTKSGMFAGTPPYAAPEQMFGERTEASDWYAFGTMLFEALAGERPFEDPNPMTLLRMKQEQDPPLLADREGLPGDLSALADGLLRREPCLRLLGSAIGEALGLGEETRIPNSTHDSQGSTGSVDAEDGELGEFLEEEIVLIGREQQLAQLDDIKQAFLETRQPQVVWITGLSGEGKSSLVEKFLQPIRHGKEMLVISGRCYDRESLPFKVIDSFIDPLVRFLRSRPRSEVDSWLPEDIERLANLFPVLQRVESISGRGQHQRSVLDERTNRNLAFAAFRDLLVAISSKTPIILFADDLQWGDAESATVLSEILSARNAPQIFMIGSFRSDEMSVSPFLQVWKSLAQDQDGSPIPRMVTVTPFSADECVEFLKKRRGQIVTENIQAALLLFDEAKGNPYFLEQLLEGFDPESGDFQSLPLEEVIGRRMNRCPAGAQDLLEIVAVAGKAVRISEVATVAEMGESSPLSILTRMRSESLVRLTGSGAEQTVDTYHDKIREVVLSELEEDKSRDLHLRFVNAIADRTSQQTADDRKVDERIFDLARHLTEAADARAYGYLIQAGEVAVQTAAMDVALGLLEQAHRLEPKDARNDDKVRLRISLGKAQAATGRLDEASGSYLEALRLVSSPILKAECYYDLGLIDRRKSRHQDAIDKFRLAFAELGERIPRTNIGKLFRAGTSLFRFFLPFRGLTFRRRSEEELARLTRMLASMNWIAGQIDVPIFLFAVFRSGVVARNVSDRVAKAEAYANLAWVLYFIGVRYIPNALLNQAIKQLDSMDREPSGGFDLYEGIFSYISGKHDEAQRQLQKASERLGRYGDYREGLAVHFLWHSLAIQGRFVNAVSVARYEETCGGQTGDEIVEAYGRYGAAEGLAAQGQIQEAYRLARAAVETLAKLNGTYLAVAYIQLARVQIQDSDFVAALRSLGLAIRDLPRLRLCEISAPAFGLYVEAALGDQWHDPSARIGFRRRMAVSGATFFSKLLAWLWPNQAPSSLRMRARWFVKRGKQRRAVKCFDAAIQSAQQIDSQHETAKALIDKSQLDYPDAMADRQRGLELLESSGCILSDAEVRYLGIDREAHHVRAAEARAMHEAELER